MPGELFSLIVCLKKVEEKPLCNLFTSDEREVFAWQEFLLNSRCSFEEFLKMRAIDPQKVLFFPLPA